jgi:hypothetical protein
LESIQTDVSIIVESEMLDFTRESHPLEIEEVELSEVEDF